MMNKNTMTDEQIIKALECCTQSVYNCPLECPLYDICEKGATIVEDKALDLINRQKAEIEELHSDKIIAETHEKAARDLFVDCTRQLEEANTKIERLQTRNDELNILNKTAAQEAIKEFAERLKEIIYTHENRVDVDGIVLLTRIDNSIDNLVKEMTEVQE